MVNYGIIMALIQLPSLSSFVFVSPVQRSPAAADERRDLIRPRSPPFWTDVLTFLLEQSLGQKEKSKNLYKIRFLIARD